MLRDDVNQVLAVILNRPRTYKDKKNRSHQIYRAELPVATQPPETPENMADMKEAFPCREQEK